MKIHQVLARDGARTTPGAGPGVIGPPVGSTLTGTLVGLKTATRGTVLVVRLRDGREITTFAASTADPDRGHRVVAGLRRLLWLRIDLTDGQRPCTLVGTGYRGPRTRTLPLSAALALAAAGIHTIVAVPTAQVLKA
jgi:hypothetical protein